MNLQYKSSSLEVKDVDTTTGTVIGYFSTTGVWDEGGCNMYGSRDMVMPGAFTKTIAERGKAGGNRIAHLWMHDPFSPLSKPDLEEDALGLRFTSTICQTSYGQDVLKLYQDGVITEHSMGYSVPKGKEELFLPDDPRRTPDMPEGLCRRIYEVQLWEGSSVVWGANPLTPTVAVKSLTHEAQMQAIGRITRQIKSAESSLKRSHLSTDEVCQALELALKQWSDELHALQAAMVEPAQPLNSDQEPRADISAELASLRQLLNLGA